MKLDHVALIVSDMDTALDFYTVFMGLEIKREFELSEEEARNLFNVASPAKAVQLCMNEGMLELFEFKRGIEAKGLSSPLANGLFHYALRLGRPIEDFIAQARKRNVPVYSIQRGGKTILFIQDPDGIFIEVKE